ncbi:MAG: hypothetical protein L6Q49_18410, partial [Anaerolineales bacterium]|nr:hypothetical protein [Anaerolineales bacterium]
MASISSPVTLNTKRLILRQFIMDDRETLFTITQERDILQYFPARTAWSMEKTERYLAHQLDHWEKFGYGHW